MISAISPLLRLGQRSLLQVLDQLRAVRLAEIGLLQSLGIRQLVRDHRRGLALYTYAGALDRLNSDRQWLLGRGADDEEGRERRRWDQSGPLCAHHDSPGFPDAPDTHTLRKPASGGKP